jgi:hypothetical protein
LCFKDLLSAKGISPEAAPIGKTTQHGSLIRKRSFFSCPEGGLHNRGLPAQSDKSLWYAYSPSFLDAKNVKQTIICLTDGRVFSLIRRKMQPGGRFWHMDYAWNGEK